MGFFSNLFKMVTQPIMPIVQATNNIVTATTSSVDSITHTVTSALAPIPVVGEVADKFVFFPVDSATDLVDSSYSYANATTGNALWIGSDALDLNLGAIGGDLGQQFDLTGQLVTATGDTVNGTLSNIFNFG